jgi:hypothetical protein
MPQTQIEVTNELLEAAMSAAGGWSRPQLAILGVEWPPVKGWRTAVIGTLLDAEKAATLVSLKDAHKSAPKATKAHQASHAA